LAEPFAFKEWADRHGALLVTGGRLSVCRLHCDRHVDPVRAKGRAHGLKALSDEQLDQAIEALRAMLDQNAGDFPHDALEDAAARLSRIWVN
jgi:hypothetical protein